MEQGQLDVEFSKLRSLPVSQMNRPALLLAAKRTFCQRRMKMDRDHPSFGECANDMLCYTTFPDLVSFPFKLQLSFMAALKTYMSYIAHFDQYFIYFTLIQIHVFY
jgi:hypothetical protein